MQSKIFVFHIESEISFGARVLPIRNRLSTRPVIPELGGGRWQILWLGKLRPSTAQPVGYDVQVHLTWGGSGYKAPVTRWVPLTNLVFLRPQSLWTQGAFEKHPEGAHRTFQVLVESGRVIAPWDRSKDSLLLLEDYRFHAETQLAPCWVFETSDQEELVVPSWEVLRSWYLFDHEVMPAILAGALRNIDALPHSLRPWLEPSGLDANGDYQIVRPQRLSLDQMKRIARLVFDDRAFDRSYDIYRQLMAGLAAADQKDPQCEIPVVPPPHDGVGEWSVTCKKISQRNGKQRWLVLSLNGAKAPTPFPRLQIVDERDNSQGENHDDPTLPTYARRSSARVTGVEGDGLVQSRVRPGELIDSVLVDGFDFEDSIVTEVETIRLKKALQVSRVQHLPVAPVIVEGGAADPTGSVRKRYARVTIDGSFAPLSNDALLRRTLNVFNRMIQSGVGSTAGKRGLLARLITNNSDETYQVRSKKSGLARHFVILEVRYLDRYAYVLDAERRGSEEFSLFLCRSTDRMRLSLSVFDAWLTKFPAKKGSPWEGSEIMPTILFGKSTIHQPHKPGSTIESGNVKLRERLDKIIPPLL